MKLLTMKRFITFLCITLIFACSNSDDYNGFLGDDNPQGRFISATIDGVSFLSDNPELLPNGQLFELDELFGFSLVAAQLESNFTSRTITIGLSGMNFDQVTAGFETSDGENNFGVTGGVLLIDTNGYNTDGHSEGNAYIKITSIDKTNRVASGEFSFSAIDENDLTNIIEVTNGVFNNMSYDISE